MPRALVLAAAVLAQAAAPADLQQAVWDAVQPVLTFPAATDENVPVDGSTSARWIVRRARADEGSLVAEVIANPLNREAQTQAARDMAAIQQEVFAAERRAQAEFERASREARQTGSAIVRGITLDDEGVAGDRADAEERMTIEVESRAEHVARIEAVEAPAVKESASGGVWIVTVPAREVRAPDASPARYFPAQAIVYLASARPVVNSGPAQIFTVRATSADRGAVVAVTLRGNRDLIDAVVARADWSRVASRAR